MPARSFLRGRSAFIAFAALLLCASGGKAQEILKELEQSDRDPSMHSGHNHGHDAAPGDRKTSKENKGHTGHQHATSKQKKKDGDHQHAMSGDKGKHAGSHGASHTGAGHGDQHQMHGFLGPYPIRRGKVRYELATRRNPALRRPCGLTATGKPCTTRYSTSCTITRVARAVAAKPLTGMFMGMAQRPLGDGTSACARC